MAETPEPIDPDRILEQDFTMVRRGLDPLEVQRYLLQLANQIRAGREREAELRHRVDEAEQRTAPIDQLEPSQLTRLLGEETARILEAAQAALDAGCDVALICNSPDKADAILAGLKGGTDTASATRRASLLPLGQALGWDALQADVRYLAARTLLQSL